MQNSPMPVPALEGPTGTLQGVNAPALKSQSTASKNASRNAALQIKASTPDDLTNPASGEPSKGVLY
jgi:hypothetical protein